MFLFGSIVFGVDSVEKNASDKSDDGDEPKADEDDDTTGTPEIVEKVSLPRTRGRSKRK
jgi:hypothetical protein